MNTIDFKKMTIPERLKAMEALWASFLTEEADLDSPAWHQGTLEERSRKIQGGKAKFVSLKDVKAEYKP